MIPYLPLTVAEQRDLFKQEGLQVDIQDMQGGGKSLQALMAGSVDAVVGYYDHVIQMQVKGKDLVAIVLLSRNQGLALGVRSDLAGQIKRVSDLKGRNVGISAPGSSTHFFLNSLLSREGLKPTDISAISIGVGPTTMASVQQKQVDALVSLDPTLTALEERGLVRVIVDTRTRKEKKEIDEGEYPGAVVYTTRAFSERNPVTTQRLVNAMVKSLHRIRDTPLEQLSSDIPVSYFIGDKGLYLKGLEHSSGMFSPDGRFSEAALSKIVSVLSLFDEGIAKTKIDLTKTYTNCFVDQVTQ